MLSQPIPENAGRREARRQERREAILDIAQQSFFELGYAATTMSAIAARLGGSKATLWQYFRCKEELFDAVVDRATAEFQAAIALALVPGGEVADGLRRFARRFIARILSPEAIALYRLVIAESRRFPETGRIFYDRAPRRTCETVTQFIAASPLPIADPALAARQFMALCLGHDHQQMLLGFGEPPDEARIAEEADQAVATFLAAYNR
jgi:AcrR family transcriptional regulator